MSGWAALVASVEPGPHPREDARQVRTPGGAGARARLRKVLRASPKGETAYVLGVVAAFREMHRRVLEHVEPAIRAIAGPDDERKDDDTTKPPEPLPEDFLRKTLAYVKDRSGRAFNTMGKAVDEHNAEGLGLLGITPTATGSSMVLKLARDRNIRLVENAGRRYATDVRYILDDPKNYGRRVEEIRALLVDRGTVSVSRATLIARDQTLKLNAALTRARHEAAGITRYTWSTSHDDRVRPMHDDLDGEEFDYDEPPPTNDAGDENNPGEDYQCRCIAIPVLPDYDEEGDEDETGEEPEGEGEGEGSEEEAPDEEAAGELEEGEGEGGTAQGTEEGTGFSGGGGAGSLESLEGSGDGSAGDEEGE